MAADGAVSRAIPNNLNNAGAADGETVSRATSRTTVSRATPNASSEKEVSRGTASRTGADKSKTTTSRSTAARTTTTSASRGTTSRAGADTKTSASRSTTGDINSNPAVRRAGVVLRPSFADYGGRATIAGTDQQTGSNIRNDIQKISSRASKINQATKESITEAKERMELTAELNQSCQEQYNECMDQFCSVIDANQKRCSCSANLSKYTKVEKAVTEANTKLNEVAQAIRYVGLSADEIRAIMSETEAEEALDENKDTSTTRNMLKQIESMIKDPKASTTSYYTDTGWSLDMDLTFSSDPIDIFNLDFLNTGTSSTSISNLRGTDLYNVAKKRCKTILTQCKDAGATQDQITGNYDLAIDKDCIAYEAGLKKMNETLVSNVKSANLMLQKARLAVLQNKNQYDARACVSALENCMKDDMVCGDDYYQCVDPTKAYIDENGEVVLGQDITVIQSFMTEYNNASIDAEFLDSAYGTTVDAKTCDHDGKCVVKYLLQKIGTKQKATDEGLCRPVLDKCQYYTYTNGKYNMHNDIVVNYIQRAMVNIKAAQQKIISDYASSCILDVASCYNQQVTQVNTWASAASASNIYNVMRGACRSVALTCGLAIFAGEPKIKTNTIINGSNTYQPYTVSGCTGTSGKTYGSADYNDAIVNCVSDMFYQSLLCPDNSTYQTSGTSVVQPNGTVGGWVNTKCKCNSGFEVYSGECVETCYGNDSYRNSMGGCSCNSSDYKYVTGTGCVSKSSGGGGGGSGVSAQTGSVTFYCTSGGTALDGLSNLNNGDPVTMPTDASSCGGDAQLKGWRCTGYDEMITPGNSISFNLLNGSQMDCTAEWLQFNYQVSFDLNGGSGTAPSSVTVTYGGAMPAITSNPPTKTGSTFNGWFDEQSGGTQYYYANGTSARDWDKKSGGILYAGWTTNSPAMGQYTIMLNNTDNGGSGSGALYTKQGTGLYSDAGRTQQLSTSSTVTIPTKSKSVFKGYFGSTIDDDSKKYVDYTGHITQAGINAAMGYNSNETWYAVFGSCVCTKGSNVSGCEITGVNNNRCTYSFTCTSGYSYDGNASGSGQGTAGNPNVTTPNCTQSTSPASMPRATAIANSLNSETGSLGANAQSETGSFAYISTVDDVCLLFDISGDNDVFQGVTSCPAE